MNIQTLVRVTAWCIGALALSVPIVDVTALGNRADGEGLDSTVRSLWVATLIGVPCIVIGLKGIRLNAAANRIRFRGLLYILCGSGMLLLSIFLTLIASYLVKTLNWDASIIATGPLVFGLIFIYAGTLTTISGVDIRKEIRH